MALTTLGRDAGGTFDNPTSSHRQTTHICSAVELLNYSLFRLLNSFRATGDGKQQSRINEFFGTPCSS